MNFKKTLSLSFIVISLFSCGMRRKHTSTLESLNVTNSPYGINSTTSHWELVEINGKPINNHLPKEVFLKLDGNELRFNASGGCNVLAGGFKILNINTYHDGDEMLVENGKIEFYEMISTQMMCLDMKTENELKNVLEVADHYVVKGTTLTLNKGKITPLARFVASESLVDAKDFNGDWELDYLQTSAGDLMDLFPDKKPNIVFNFPDKKLIGTGGCNRFSSNFNVEGNSIKIDNSMSTKMLCRGDGEAEFFKILSKVNKFSFSEDKRILHFIVGDLVIMRFHKIK